MKSKKENSGFSLLSNSLYLLKFAYKANKAVFFTQIPSILVCALIPFVPILMLRLLLNEITGGKDRKLVLLYTLILAGALFVLHVLQSIFSALALVQTEKTVYKIKEMLGEAVTNLPYSELEKPKMKDFISLAQDGSSFSGILNEMIAMITSFLTVVGLTAIVFTVQPMIFFLILIVISVRLLTDKKSRGLWEKWRPRFAPIMRQVDYYFKIMRNTEYGKEIRTNGMEEWVYDRVDKNSEVYLNESLHHNIAIQRNNSIVEFVVVGQECIVYLILAHKVVFGGIPIGDFSMYLTSINSFTEQVRSMIASFSNLMEKGLFARDFRYCMELSKRLEHHIDGECQKCGDLTIEFNNVSFRYPNTERWILRNISVKIMPKETLSIVGMNGAGKTTFVKLLCRFYEPTEGDILIGGVPIHKIAREEYYDMIGVVFQDFKLFAFEVGENITLGDEGHPERVSSCIENSGLGDKIKSLSKGLNTMLYKEFDESGIEFSGGEAQKLAIARTLYKDAPIIILDEPTSALDPIAEYEIYRHFDTLVSGKSAIYISHRLSSTRFTDKIAVFSEGRMKEYGHHKELIRMEDGIYRNMFEMQAQYYIRSGEALSLEEVGEI